MFTGIIEATAEVLKIGEGTLVLKRPKNFKDVKIGSSIAVSGVCLSVTYMNASSLAFDVIPVTLKKTTLGQLKKKSMVNLERAMKASSRFDGHIVQGHCEGVGKVVGVTKKGRDVIIAIAAPKELRRAIVKEGSVTIDGVSLTVAAVTASTFSIALIPHTLKTTTLKNLEKGSSVNVETDVILRFAASGGRAVPSIR